MSFNALYDTAGSALNAQTIRLNTVSSNLANADSVASNPNDVYKALKPVFSSVYNQFQSEQLENPTSVPVYIADVVTVESMVEGRYEPNNPLANEDGYIYHSGINVVNEMADMMSATRSFEASAEVLSNVKSMQQSLLRLMEA